MEVRQSAELQVLECLSGKERMRTKNRILIFVVFFWSTTQRLRAQTLADSSTTTGEASATFPALTTGRLQVRRTGSVMTGGMFANPNSQTAIVSYFFTDAASNSAITGAFTIPANGQASRFFNELSGSAPSSGTFTYSSNVPLSVAGLRGITNERGAFLMTASAAAPLQASSGSTMVTSPPNPEKSQK